MSTKEKELTPLELMLAQYEANNKPKYATSETAKVYDLKNYFNTFIGKTVKSATKEIRILPSKTGTPFSQMYGHKWQVDGEWKTFPCLKHEEDKPCPFCEARELLLATGEEADKTEAKKYSPRLMYIVKVIDRNLEEEGVKFWRFNHDYRKEGAFDKIHGTMVSLKKNQDVSDALTGRDLVLTINKNQNDAPIITTITALDSTPLSEDPEKTALWLADERTWKDVYSTRNYDYLEIVVRGKVPAWNVDEKKWVDKDTLKAGANNTTEEEATVGIENVKANIKVAKPALVTEPVDVPEDEGDDLPF
jgi:hypothetical protein